MVDQLISIYIEYRNVGMGKVTVKKNKNIFMD